MHFDISPTFVAFQRTLRLAMPSENRVARQQRPAVAFRQNIRQRLALVESALEPPLFAQRHGQDEIEVFRRQPVRCVLAHQIRQRTAHAQVGQVFQLAYHAADGRFVIQRGPHSIKCGRLFLTTAAHHPARDRAETQRAALCRVDKIFRQIVCAASAKAV